VSTTFSGTRRFKVLRKLGEGGMGAVYECQDVEAGTRVALKTLLFSSASTLLRFKDEFRQFQGIHHPNLVSLGELFEEDGSWHFTMELVRGADFLAYVRPSAPARLRESTADAKTVTAHGAIGDGVASSRALFPYDEVALRGALGQLARALSALHEAGKVHRDVKPSNVLVTLEGRAVLLDFGIATDISRREQLAEIDAIVGTPHYMAPEQAAGMPVSASADWYAVGALLYEVLTGQLPFEGTLLQVIEDKQRKVPRHARELAPSVPEDLATLAMELLAIDPAARPLGKEVLRRLDALESVPPVPMSMSVTRTDTQTTPLIGREAELAALEACLARVRDHREAVAMYVHGESGIGKSALVARFADNVRTVDPSAVVLAGACYEHEAVPYKAVDGVVDALSKYLGRLPPTTAAALLPRHATSLAQAFPVLGRVEAFADQPPPRVDIDPLERRTRVFGALRELLVRLGDRGPLVLCVDDLQWADADSIALLGDILRPPESPALLLVATLRSVPGGFELPTGPTALPPGGTVLHLDSLSATHARELTDSLARRLGGTSIDAASIVREAQGYPLFIHELVRYHATQTDRAPGTVGLDDALWARIDALDDAAKRMLQVTALAPSAMMQGIATRAAGIDPGEAVKYIKQLKVAHLVRTTGGTRATDLIEPYHSRVREAVHGRMAPGGRQALHRRLALTMETSGQQEYEQLAVHWREAGEKDRAAEAARRAAARAEDALAFDRAAGFYRMVDELVELSPRERRALLVRLGDALANAGRSQEAAEVFREAAQGAGPVEARELARRAAQHLLRSGHIEQGLVELRRVLGTVSIAYPETTGAAVASLLWSRARLALRGLSYRTVDEADIAPGVLAQLDACWAATTGLFVVDQLRGVDFHFRHLLLALSAGEPSRTVRALASHAIATVTAGQKHRGEADRILALATALSDKHGSPYSRALISLTAGTTAYLGGSFRASIEKGTEAIDLLRGTCQGVAWELATARQLVFWSLALTGNLEELARLTRSTLRETLESGDHYAAMSIRSGLPNAIWLAQGDPRMARKEADEAIAAWSDGSAFLQHLMDLVSQTGIDLYEGNARGAVERVERMRSKLEDAGLTRVEFNRVLLLDVCSRASLAAARAADPRDRRPHLESARRDVASLAKEAAPWARALAEAKTVALARIEGRTDPEMSKRAVRSLLAVDLDVYAASMAHAADLDAIEARGLFAREHIQDPTRFAQVFAPGI